MGNWWGGSLRSCRKILLASVLTVAACSTTAPSQPPASFAAYQAEAEALVAQRRAFQTHDRRAEISFNAPQEWRPEGRPERGILLVHGLGDSPFSFTDIGPVLAQQGFLVRTVLLPGHGTRPADLIDVSNADWHRVVAQQTELLKRDAGDVFLGGFSTGANLVTARALADDEIAGLLLFSPGFISDGGLEWVAPLIAPFVTWLRAPDPLRPQQNPVRYLNVPTNGFGQFHHTSTDVRAALAARTYDKPALIVMTRHDSVLDAQGIADLFTDRFKHPASRLIWYGDPPAIDDPRIVVRPDHLPDYRISQFSHMSVLFSPNNPLYGREGSLRLCENGQNPGFYDRCKNGEEVWYSDWGFEMPDRIHARLTFNPYFDWQMQVAGEVLGRSSSGILAGQP
jgi:esterase/lipase